MAIKDLGNFDYDEDKGGNIPADVKALSGATIRLHGFMIPMDQAENITQFALVPSLFACCFGQPPQIQHTIVGQLPQGQGRRLFPRRDHRRGQAEGRREEGRRLHRQRVRSGSEQRQAGPNITVEVTGYLLLVGPSLSGPPVATTRLSEGPDQRTRQQYDG